MVWPSAPLSFEEFPIQAFRSDPSLSSVSGESGSRMRPAHHSVFGGHDRACTILFRPVKA